MKKIKNFLKNLKPNRFFVPLYNRKGKDGKLYADGSFAAQNLSIAPMSYVEHTFTFSGDAVQNYGADLSFLNVKYSTRAVH